jgi:uncharacterized protein
MMEERQMTELEQFRQQKDAFFRSHPESPLRPEQQQGFAGLRYFPENPDLRFEVAVELFAEQTEVTMQTSTGEARTYQRYGQFRFAVEGQDVALTLYADAHGFFLPFADALAGTQTYGAGRYLDPQPRGSNHFLVDFNLAYNPYCAYNAQWSCPLTPWENRLRVPIRAGEQLFAAAHAELLADEAGQSAQVP